MTWVGCGRWRWFTIVVLLGCGSGGTVNDSEGRRRSRVGDEVRGSTVVAVVDGHPITVDDVTGEAQAGEDLEATLKRLVDLELIAEEARARGLAEDPGIQRFVDRTASRLLLRRSIEEEVTALSIPEERFRDAFASASSRFSKPERRDAEHFLARPAENGDLSQARRLAERVLAEARVSEEPHAVFTRISQEVADDARARVEDLGEFRSDAALVQPFLDAAFSVTEPGVVPRVVQTEFGFHVIHVRAVLPPLEIEYEEARGLLEDEVVLAERRARLEQLLQRLWDEEGVEVDLDAVRATDLDVGQ